MFGGISLWQLLIILLIVILLFGTKKLKNMGGDLGEAIKGFKKGIKDEDKPDDNEQKLEQNSDSTTDNVKAKDTEKS